MPSAAVVQSLADSLRRRGVRQLVYFHCDHWEPWKVLPGLTRSKSLPVMVERVRRFIDAMNETDFTRRLTLFYKPDVYTTLDEGKESGVKAAANDAIVFRARDQAQRDHGRAALQDIVTRSAHGIEVHIHHEAYTYNTSPVSAAVGAFLASPTGRANEEARFDLAVRLCLATIREQTDLPLARWFFVHGHWGLQGSDPTVCHLTREIEILAANGCKGDFTCPSGRARVNPRLDLPYLITPVSAAKGYDCQHAMPERAFGNAAAAAHKFFVWSSLIKHRGCSLDCYAPWVRQRLNDPLVPARDLIEDSYLAGDTLFLKTHSHSMHPHYFADDQPGAFPLAEPAVQRLYGTIADAAAAAGVPIVFLTAAEVYDALVTADHTPTEGFTLTMPGAEPDGSEIDPAPFNLDIAPARPADPWQS